MTVQPTPEELLERALNHSAILQHVLRKLARAHHRAHADEGVLSWFNCTEHFCAMAREAADGEYTIATASPHGTVLSVVKRSA